MTDTARTGFHVNYNLGGSSISRSHSTKFQQGIGQEEFVWLKSGDDLHLLHYNIKSDGLNDENVR